MISAYSKGFNMSELSWCTVNICIDIFTVDMQIFYISLIRSDPRKIRAKRFFQNESRGDKQIAHNEHLCPNFCCRDKALEENIWEGQKKK